MKIFKIQSLLMTYSNAKGMSFKLIVFSAISGLLDAFGVISVMPFVASVQNPEFITNNLILANFISYLNIANDQFIVFFGIVVLSVFLFGSIIKLLLIYYQTIFIHHLEAESARYYLNKNFSSGFIQYLEQGRSSLSRKLFSDSEQLVKYIFYPFVNVVSNFFILLFILSSLYLVFGYPVFIPVFFVIAFYLLIYFFGRKFINRFSASRDFYNRKRFRIVDDISNYYSNILVSSSNNEWESKFYKAEKKFLRSRIGIDIFNNTPRITLELLIVVIGVSTILLSIDTDSKLMFDPIYNSFLIVAAYKIIPSFQMLYKSINSINFGYNIFTSHIALNDVKLDFSSTYSYDATDTTTNILSIRNLSHRLGDNFFLENINADIPSNGISLLIGSSGSGKTTLIHIILGLIRPNKGQIILSSGLSVGVNGYLENVSFVPQGAPLYSGTILDNLTGSDKNIDEKRALSSLEDVNLLAEFNDMGIKLNTFLSERGDSLSGGQRQRLAIARSLINDTKLLILDEPTSALDTHNSNIINDLLNEISKKIPVLIVSHDKKLTKYAKTVYLLSNNTMDKIKNDKKL